MCGKCDALTGPERERERERVNAFKILVFRCFIFGNVVAQDGRLLAGS